MNIELLKEKREQIIEKYSVKGEKEFYEEELIQTWIIHNLQIIGEASRATSEAF